MNYEFDRYLRYDELVAWLHHIASAHPELVALETYGTSHEGRDLWLLTITDASTGAHDTKPAHWLDASIHSIELTATVAACHLIDHLVSGYGNDDNITRALQTRTFYVVPRVNPDGAEAVLADQPVMRRSSMRPWPLRDGHRWPGLHSRDIDGDGRVLEMRVADPHGDWMAHPEHPALMVRIPPEGVGADVQRYRVLPEADVEAYDGFTLDSPRPVEGLDLNRNFPARWGTGVTGSGDHPLSEPEIDALVRAISARPNICGYHACHTSGGVLLRPSSYLADSALPPFDVWLYGELGARGTELTEYPVHGVFEDFTFDKSRTMSGAADDWMYEHKGVIGWTTEFWDIVKAATGTKQSTKFWYTGPSNDELVAVYNWCAEHQPGGHVDWYAYDHPTLGRVELGGWNDLITWTNPPADRLRDEVAGHSKMVVHQALCAPELQIVHTAVTPLGNDTYQVDVGVANTGWLSTDITDHARRQTLTRAVEVELTGGDFTCVDGPARRRLSGSGQLDGRAAMVFNPGGTPDRALVRFTVQAAAGTTIVAVARHQRAGSHRRTITVGA